MDKLVRRGARAAVVGGAAALLLPVLAMPAAAHIHADPNEADSGDVSTSLEIDHGCDGSPTVEIRIQLPEGVVNTTASEIEGWETEVVEDDGRVVEVAWVDGVLPDGEAEDFRLDFQVTEEAEEVIWLPTIQLCEEGEHRWIEIPDSVDGWGALPQPAPYVVNNVPDDQLVEVVTPEPTEDPTPTPDDDLIATPAPAETTDEAAADDNGGASGWVFALVAVVVIALAGLGAVLLRRRNAGAA